MGNIIKEFCDVHYHLMVYRKLESPHYNALANTFLTHNCIWKIASIQWLSLGGSLEYHLVQLPSLKSHQVGQLTQFFYIQGEDPPEPSRV